MPPYGVPGDHLQGAMTTSRRRATLRVLPRKRRAAACGHAALRRSGRPFAGRDDHIAPPGQRFGCCREKGERRHVVMPPYGVSGDHLQGAMTTSRRRGDKKTAAPSGTAAGSAFSACSVYTGSYPRRSWSAHTAPAHRRSRPPAAAPPPGSTADPAP